MYMREWLSQTVLVVNALNVVLVMQGRWDM